MGDSFFIDKYGRQIGNLRLSVTDRCNFRCIYCLPDENVTFLKQQHLLTFDEIIRLVKIFSRHGVKKVRLTGGEPTMRPKLCELIQRIKNETEIEKISITTNGSRLKELAKPLKKAGISTVNISLDTLDPEKFKKITQRNYFKNVIEGIEEAVRVGFDQVKINVVAMRNINFEDAAKLVSFGIERGIIVRFIELMPFKGNNWEKENMVTMDELIEKLRETFDLTPINKNDPSQTALEYMINEDPSKRVGFIASVTRSFCQWCNRVRITADGHLRPCLHNPFEVDLKAPIRNGASDEELEKIIQNAIWQKSRGHPDFLSTKFELPSEDKPMMKIGG